jgi:hypothetical protein
MGHGAGLHYYGKNEERSTMERLLIENENRLSIEKLSQNKYRLFMGENCNAGGYAGTKDVVDSSQRFRIFLWKLLAKAEQPAGGAEEIIEKEKTSLWIEKTSPDEFLMWFSDGRGPAAPTKRLHLSSSEVRLVAYRALAAIEEFSTQQEG